MRKREIFFISLFTVSFMISALVMTGDRLLKNLEKNLDLSRPQHSMEEQQEASEEKVDATEGTEAESSGETEASTESSTEEIVEKPKTFVTVDRSYFDDALFVGDSRMVGIMEYGGLEQATFFADSGMSAYGLELKKIAVPGIGKLTFEELLEQKQFRKIYLMLGFNELGYRFDAAAQKYMDTVAKIRDRQPDAILYLCANMHVTKEQSDKEEIYNNANVDRMNEMISGLADGENIFYIDVNELFDDDTGSLAKEYSSDAFHVYGRYYVDWVDWLCTKAIE